MQSPPHACRQTQARVTLPATALPIATPTQAIDASTIGFWLAVAPRHTAGHLPPGSGVPIDWIRGRFHDAHGRARTKRVALAGQIEWTIPTDATVSPGLARCQPVRGTFWADTKNTEQPCAYPFAICKTRHAPEAHLNLCPNHCAQHAGTKNQYPFVQCASPVCYPHAARPACAPDKNWHLGIEFRHNPAACRATFQTAPAVFIKPAWPHGFITLQYPMRRTEKTARQRGRFVQSRSAFALPLPAVTECFRDLLRNRPCSTRRRAHKSIAFLHLRRSLQYMRLYS